MTRLLRICIVLAIYFSAQARQLVTPLDLQRGPLNKPYTDISRNDSWLINIWAGGYERSAKQAYNHNGCEVPLSTLFFNKANFNPQEAFANSTVAASTFTLNPLLATSILGPRVRYEEKGAVVGLDVQHCFHECWRLGVRASIPAKKIRIKRLPSHGNGMSDLGGETIDEFLGERIETVNGAAIKSFAYRLDFLTKLPYTCKPCPTASLPIVNYADTDFPPNNPISISKQDITNQSGTPVSALESTSGSLPRGPWAIPEATAQALPILNADGSNLPDQGRGRFASSVVYTPLGNDSAHQAMLFIVPSVVGTTTTQEARVIQAQVEEVLVCIAPEAEDIFANCGISFSSQSLSGAGDLDTEFYTGHFFSPCFYVEGYAGVRWPTAKRSNKPQFVFRPSLGNNGHYELKAGAQAIWKPCRWAALRGDITGHGVLRASECVAASFVGAQIKNIGTPVRANVHWSYYLLHVDMLFTPPNCHGFGGVIGYENYHKTCDHLNFCTSKAIDCLGVTQPLDAHLIRKNTNATSHKVRGEAFIELWRWLQVFGGASKVFSGRNVPKETEWYVGINAYF